MPRGGAFVPTSSRDKACERAVVHGSSFLHRVAINSAMSLFRPNCYVEVGKEGVDAKIKALSMYRGVMRTYLILVQ